MGIRVVDVNFQSARPPEAVKDAFDDAIAAREDEERYVREAEAYSNDILPKATGRAERLKNEAQGYSERVINGALGDVAQFDKLLPQYEAAKKVTRERLYLDTMERVYSNTSKVLIDTKSGGNNVMYLPLEKLMNQSNNQAKKPVDSGRLSGIELEKVETPTPVAPAPRADTGRQGRY